MLDVIIIGAGVSGCACARELARRKASILVLEKEEDVCCGTSKANSAIVHAGYDAPHGSLMARLNVQGSRMMPALAKELDFAYRRCGSLVVCLDEADRPALQALYQNGAANGVEGLRIVEREELRAMEPNAADEAVAALWAPTGAIVCPFGLTFALAENAAANGVRFQFDTAVTGVAAIDGGWRVQTAAGAYEARCVVNAAGVYADTVHNWVRGDDPLTIVPRRGEYFLLDHAAGDHVRHTVFQLPGRLGKGVLVTPTVHGNLLVGPTAQDISGKDDTATTAAGLDELRAKAGLAVKDIPLRQTITSFAGLRAHEPRHEFFIGEIAPGFVDCAAIESPGLSSAPAIGVMVADLVTRSLALPENPALRERHRGRDRRRHPPHAGRAQPGRRQAPHPRRHGPVPGRFLQPARDGNSGAGAGRAAGRRDQGGRGFAYYHRRQQGRVLKRGTLLWTNRNLSSSAAARPGWRPPSPRARPACRTCWCWNATPSWAVS